MLPPAKANPPKQSGEGRRAEDQHEHASAAIGEMASRDGDERRGEVVAGIEAERDLRRGVVRVGRLEQSGRLGGSGRSRRRSRARTPRCLRRCGRAGRARPPGRGSAAADAPSRSASARREPRGRSRRRQAAPARPRRGWPSSPRPRRRAAARGAARRSRRGCPSPARTRMPARRRKEARDRRVARCARAPAPHARPTRRRGGRRPVQQRSQGRSPRRIRPW